MTESSTLLPAAHLIERLERSDTLSDAEKTALEQAVVQTETRAPRTLLVERGRPIDHSILLINGVVSRQVHLAAGRRQILALHVPGDFVDLHGFLLKSLDHDVCAIGPVTVAIVPHAALARLTEDQPHLTRLLWFATTVDASMHREWIASLSRGAEARVAHLICELRLRLEVVGRADAYGFDLPLTQVDLADATSLTPVHVNRTLRRLRERGLMDVRSGQVSIGDLAGLEAVAGFDPGYLFLDREPR